MHEIAHVVYQIAFKVQFSNPEVVTEVFKLGTCELVVFQADLPQFMQFWEVLKTFQLAIRHRNSLDIYELLQELLVAFCELSDLYAVKDERCFELFRVLVCAKKQLQLLFDTGHLHS